MGRWSKAICGGDKYADFEANLLHQLGWRDNEDEEFEEENYRDHTERITKEDFEKFGIENIIEWMKSEEMDIEHGIFLAYHLLVRGVDVSDERLDKFIEFCKEDGWAEQDIERRIYMKLAIDKIQKYKTDKTPVDIDVEYNFEKYFINKEWVNEESKMSVEQIKTFFETYAEVKILQTVRSYYELYFVISPEQYKQIDGQSIMGIKFLVDYDETVREQGSEAQ